MLGRRFRIIAKLKILKWWRRVCLWNRKEVSKSDWKEGGANRRWWWWQWRQWWEQLSLLSSNSPGHLAQKTTLWSRIFTRIFQVGKLRLKCLQSSKWQSCVLKPKSESFDCQFLAWPPVWLEEPFAGAENSRGGPGLQARWSIFFDTWGVREISQGSFPIYNLKYKSLECESGCR